MYGFHVHHPGYTPVWADNEARAQYHVRNFLSTHRRGTLSNAQQRAVTQYAKGYITAQECLFKLEGF